MPPRNRIRSRAPPAGSSRRDRRGPRPLPAARPAPGCRPGPAAAGLAPRDASAQSDPLTRVNGRIVQTGPSGPEPAPCCEVEARLSTVAGSLVSQGFALSQPDGSFVTHVSCETGTSYVLEVIA